MEETHNISLTEAHVISLTKAHVIRLRPCLIPNRATSPKNLKAQKLNKFKSYLKENRRYEGR